MSRPAAVRTLTLRALNRATLARQMLLEREPISVSDAVGRLVALQAQLPNPPYVGLWTRLRDFRREDLTNRLEQRRIVRSTFVRSTLHLATAEDYLLLRRALQPVLDRALRGTFGRRATGLDVERLVAAAREHVEVRPRTLAELRTFLSGVEPGEDPEAMVSAVARAHLPLVQVPPSGTWGSVTREYAVAESWLDRPLAAPEEGLRHLVPRYLAAFGPATVKDAQKWSGLPSLRDAIEDLKPDLLTFRDEWSNELFDLPDAPLPAGDVPAPPRFLPEYDNLVLSHADRGRVVADEYRTRVSLPSAVVRPTFLLDGFVAGAWKVERARDGPTARLVIEPFGPLARKDRDALAEEGERLLRFVAGSNGTEEFGVQFKRED